MHPIPPTPDKRTFEIAEQLSAMEKSDDIDAYAPKVIDIMTTSGDRLRIIDSRPCYFNELEGRFHMLRRVRNHPVWGPKLLRAAALKRRPRVNAPA